LAYDMVKYRQREGWSHRDLLRLSHPKTDRQRRALFDWICGRESEFAVPPIVDGYERAQRATTTQEWVEIIKGTPGLSWEMLPDAAVSTPAVWEALISKGLPQTALMRQLPRLTRLGLLSPMSATCNAVTAQLCDPERLRKVRVHPVNVLVALRTYAAGTGMRGQTWQPVGQVVASAPSWRWTCRAPWDTR
jgi:60 kDa SS-A/Ro ribonucleoprotein